jgi:AcrR family transcriptional regulator
MNNIIRAIVHVLNSHTDKVSMAIKKSISTLKQRKNPSQERSQDTVETILEAAAHILVEEGYESFNTNSVSKKAGVSIGSLYQYFPNKESLFQKFLQYQFDREKKYLFKRLDEIDEVNLEKYCEAFVDAMTTFMQKRKPFRKLAIDLFPQTLQSGLQFKFRDEIVAKICQMKEKSIGKKLSDDEIQSVKFSVMSVIGILAASFLENKVDMVTPEFRNQLVQFMFKQLA